MLTPEFSSVLHHVDLKLSRPSKQACWKIFRPCWKNVLAENMGPSQNTLRPLWCPELASSMLARCSSETEFWIDQHYNNFILSLRCGQIGHATDNRDWTEFYQFGLPCDIYSGMLKWLLTFMRMHKVNLKAIRPPPGC